MQNAVFQLLAFVPVLSQLGEGADVEALAKYGLLGVVLAWFMIKADKRLGGIEHKMVGLNRTMLIEILSRPTTSERSKQLCRDELRKIDPSLADEIESQ
jgi:hypothetical protein